MDLQINCSFIRGFDQLLLEKGVKPTAFYQQARLPLATATSHSTISFFGELRLFDMAAKYFSEPDICLSLASRQSISALGPIAANITQQPTVHKALIALQENLHSCVEGVKLALTVSRDIARVTVQCIDQSLTNNPYLQDHALALIQMIMKTVCGPTWRPRAVYLQHPEQDNIHGYHRHFGAPIAFNSACTGLAFDPRCLTQRIAPLSLIDDVEQTPNVQQTPMNFSQQIRGVITMLISSDECNIETVAEHLFLSKRTLQRRLFDNATNFKDMVNSIRSERAIHYLQSPHYSLGEVAVMLGYSQLSAFSRSFKRWHGIAPQAWRQQNIH